MANNSIREGECRLFMGSGGGGISLWRC